MEFNLFHNWSKDYILQQRTGLSFNLDTEQINTACAGSCFPTYQRVQKDEKFYGCESKVSFPIWNVESSTLEAQLFADYVRGQLDGRGNIARLPPLRNGMQLDYTVYKDFAAGLRLTKAGKQTKVGDNETSTNGYLLLDVNMSYNLV